MTTTLVQSWGSQIVQTVGDKIQQSVNHNYAQKKSVTSIPIPQQVMEDIFAGATTFTTRQKFQPLQVLSNVATNLFGFPSLLLTGLTEISNQYETIREDGTLIVRVVEESEHLGWTGRCLCQPRHKLAFNVFSNHANKNFKLMQWNRGCKWSCCVSCCGCCRQEMSLHLVDPDGTTRSSPTIMVREPFLGGGLSPTLEIMDRPDEHSQAANNSNISPLKSSTLLRIQSDSCCCIGGLCGNHTFHIVDPATGSIVGQISKKRSTDKANPTMLELISDSNGFTVSVPAELSWQKKAAVLASLHLMEYWLFEGEGNCSMSSVVANSLAVKLCSLYCCGCICPIGCRRHTRCCWCPMVFG